MILLLRMLPRLTPVCPIVTTALTCAVEVSAALPGPAVAPQKSYDLPEGNAAATLRQFAAASGEQIVYLVDNVRGEKTKAVVGEFAAREALDRMLAGTALFASQDPTTGALVVGRTRRSGRPEKTSSGTTDSHQPPAMPKNRSPRRLTAWLSALAAPFALAQTVTTAPAPSTPTADQAVVLSPFLVTSDADTGYAATNTLDGSRLNTALRDTPAAISVFTRDFLDDIGATDVSSLMRYDLSSETDYSDANAEGTGMQSGSMNDGALWRTRGLTGQASTNSFRDGESSGDLYNVERVGASRGPNAILFGTGAAGGLLNLRTKQADPRRNRNSLEVKVGEHKVRRSTFDVNRVLADQKFGLRLMGVVDHKGSHIPHAYTERMGATLAVRLQPTPHTSLNASFDKSQTSGLGGRPWGLSDSITAFLTGVQSGAIRFDPVDGRYETLNGAVVGASAGAGALATRTVVVYGPDGQPGTLWEGNSATANRSTLATTASVFSGAKPVLPEWVARYNEVNSTGASEYGELDHRVVNLTLNHRWQENFFMELAYNFAKKNSDALIAANPELRADLDYRLPGGALNPYFYGNGYYFSQVAYVRQIRAVSDETFRASFSYDLNLRRFGHHRFAVLGERHINTGANYRQTEVWEGAPYGGNAEATANRINRRRYFRLDGPLAHYGPARTPEPFGSDAYTSAFASLRPLTSGWVPINALDANDTTTTDSQLFVMQNALFRRRLITTVGLRRDEIGTFGPRTVRDAVTRQYRLATAADQALFTPADQGWFDATALTGQRRSVGAVFHATDNFSLTANVSDGIQLPDRNRTVLPNERVPDPYTGEGRDYGLNFSFLNNRVSGSVRHFESSTLREKSNDRIQQVFIFPNNDVMASFDYYYRQAGLTTLGAGAPVGSLDDLRTIYWSTVNSYLSDRVSEGYEIEAVANPTRNWSIRLGYSWTDRTRTNVMSEGEPWWAEREALWKKLDTFYTQRTGLPSIFNQILVDRTDAVTSRTVNERIADAALELAEVRREEQQGYGNRRHKANIWTRYSFLDGRLKGAAIGGGYRYQSRNIAGVNTDTNETLYGNSSSIFDLFLQYRTRGLFGRWGDRTNVTYQVNVTNLLDDQTINITKKIVDTATGVPYVRRGFREAPRTIVFTARFDL